MEEHELEYSVDFVLVWEESISPFQNSAYVRNAEEKRRVFEANLERVGLVLERENFKFLRFIKIHATQDTLLRYAELLKLRMPVNIEHSSLHRVDREMTGLRRLTTFLMTDAEVLNQRRPSFTEEFRRDRDFLFDVESDDFFTSSIRFYIVNFILQREKFSEDDKDFGIRYLISDGVYTAAYPLHDGDSEPSMQRTLLQEWASVRKFYKLQPIDNIRDYLGEQFALYFAWLGFYTYMLIPAAIIGLICFVYGASTIYSNTLSEEICSEQHDILMCPLCDRVCTYWNLRESCLYARITHLFDNSMSLFFAIVMSFWCILFLALWKRYTNTLMHRWGMMGFSTMAEHPRPGFLARLARWKKIRRHIVTDLEEPYVPFWTVRVPLTIFTFSLMLLLVSVTVGIMFGIMVYRVSQIAAFSISYDVVNTGFMVFFIPITAALVNLVCVTLVNQVYQWLARHLTELELWRTQTEFDNSYSLKIYLFQFVNYYLSILYIATFKGQLVGFPSNYRRIFSYRMEQCSPIGCLFDLCIQLTVVMVGKQLLNEILEMMIPYVLNWFNILKFKMGLEQEQWQHEKRRRSLRVEQIPSFNQLTKDYNLLGCGSQCLVPEYLELVIQYGFVTIFVAAFPLAPLFALVNNIFELRLDAKKFLKFYRRPVPQRVNSIGVWLKILEFVSRLSVITNAFIIAFASKFIPWLFYKVQVSKDYSDVGFLNFSLSYFNTADFRPEEAPAVTGSRRNVPVCRYRDFRNPYWAEDKYQLSPVFWRMLAARFAFVVVFQTFVWLVMTLMDWLIPDTSQRVRDEIYSEAYLTSKQIMEHESHNDNES